MAMKHDPIVLDEHRGIAAQQATEIRRRLAEVEADQLDPVALIYLAKSDSAPLVAPFASTVWLLLSRWRPPRRPIDPLGNIH
jgi:hypothetical protein